LGEGERVDVSVGLSVAAGGGSIDGMAVNAVVGKALKSVAPAG
jgi:hypothetical protein